MINLSGSNVWSSVLLVGILFLSMIIAHALKNNIPFLNKSLIPASVLGGIIILIFTSIWQIISKGDKTFFELNMFSSVVYDSDGKALATAVTGTSKLEAITYHALGIGFIATALRKGKKSENKERATEIFNSGIATVATYLIQAIVGIVITFVGAGFITGLIPAAGIILCMGYGQGTGQALNFGNIYQNEFGLAYGVNFGLSIAAMGFLSASIGGVIYLNYLKRKNKIKMVSDNADAQLKKMDFQRKNEVSLFGSIDKFTIQIALVVIVYLIAYLAMKGLSLLLPGMTSTLFGFNFLFGTLIAVIAKGLLNLLRKWRIVKKSYVNDFLMNRIAGIAFDIMIVAGIAVIDLATMKQYIGILLIMGVVGAVLTFAYIWIVSKILFKKYQYEQFFAMYGMLTGTASTGMILLREIDPMYESPASNNLAYQTLPAIVFGFPLLLFIAPVAPKMNIWLVLGIIIAYFIVLNIILFRNLIFRKKTNNK